MRKILPIISRLFGDQRKKCLFLPPIAGVGDNRHKSGHKVVFLRKEQFTYAIEEDEEKEKQEKKLGLEGHYLDAHNLYY